MAAGGESGSSSSCGVFSPELGGIPGLISKSWFEWLPKFEVRLLAKRRTATPASNTSHYLCRSPHGCFLDDDGAHAGRSFGVSRWKVGGIALERRSARTELRPVACAISPMLISRDRSVRNNILYQDKKSAMCRSSWSTSCCSA